MSAPAVPFFPEAKSRATRTTASTTGAAADEHPTHILGLPTRGRVFFGWYMVGAGSIIQFLVGALMNQAYGGYAAALTAEFG